MPQKHIRKKLARATKEQIFKAKALIANGISKRAAARIVGLSASGLQKRLKTNEFPETRGSKPIFTQVQEKEFVKLCQELDELYFGLTSFNLRRLAFEYAAMNNIKNRFNKSSKMAGCNWVERFLKRNPQCVLGQSANSKEVQVHRFYSNLKDLYQKFNFQPSRIYNVDEIGIRTTPKETAKVIATNGSKEVLKVVSAKRGIKITAICCMSASGHYVPPAFIYPKSKRFRYRLLDGGPSQSIFMVSDGSSYSSELFVNWMHHFKYFVHPRQEDPVLLILDNHSSHISIEATKYAHENNIVMLTLPPPYGGREINPMVRLFHCLLNANYAIECDKYLIQHPKRGVTQNQVARLFNEAYKKIASLENAQFGFKVTGIYPYDHGLFGDADFSFITDQIHPDKEQNHHVVKNRPVSDESMNVINPKDVPSNKSPEHSAAIDIMSRLELCIGNLSPVDNDIPDIIIRDDFLTEYYSVPFNY